LADLTAKRIDKLYITVFPRYNTARVLNTQFFIRLIMIGIQVANDETDRENYLFDLPAVRGIIVGD
jgi:hypothetical protein